MKINCDVLLTLMASSLYRLLGTAVGNGYATAYGHQSRVAVSVGQVINQGQTLGYVGCTGNCSGQHLHFEVRVNGSPQNPRSYVGGSP